LANLQTTDSYDFNDLLSSTYRERYTSFEEDLLVLSCCLFRMKSKSLMSLEDGRLVSYVDPQDRRLAYDIKKYYSQKFMVARLRGDELSKFQNDLYMFIHNEYIDPKGSGMHIYSDKLLGMAYKLPYFYLYDLELTILFNGETNEINSVKVVRLESGEETRQLKYIRKTKSYRRNDDTYEYWFSDEYNNKVKVNIEDDNPLTNLFECMLNKPVNINGKFEQRRTGKLHYFSVKKWSVTPSTV